MIMYSTEGGMDIEDGWQNTTPVLQRKILL
jgi:succinyl-CoA synthetase beta subunit